MGGKVVFAPLLSLRKHAEAKNFIVCTSSHHGRLQQCERWTISLLPRRKKVNVKLQIHRFKTCLKVDFGRKFFSKQDTSWITKREKEISNKKSSWNCSPSFTFNPVQGEVLCRYDDSGRLFMILFYLGEVWVKHSKERCELRVKCRKLIFSDALCQVAGLYSTRFCLCLWYFHPTQECVLFAEKAQKLLPKKLNGR